MADPVSKASGQTVPILSCQIIHMFSNLIQYVSSSEDLYSVRDKVDNTEMCLRQEAGSRGIKIVILETQQWH